MQRNGKNTDPDPPRQRPVQAKNARDKAWKLVAESSAAQILAKDTLVPPKKPGLDRQPKEALRTKKIIKGREQPNSRASESSIGDVKIQHSKTNSSKASVLRRRSTLQSLKSKTSLPGSSISATKRESLTDSGSKGTDEDAEWALIEGEPGYEGEGILEKEPAFEMSGVEIDVLVIQKEMDKTLGRMVDEARTTVREKSILADTFAMFLQALVNMQEEEVESIDHLQTKSAILQTINYFMKAQDNLSSNSIQQSEERIDDESHGILEGLTTVVEEDTPKEDDAGRTKSGSKAKEEGVSVDDMSASVLRETYLGQRNKLDMQVHLRNINVLELRQLQFEKTLMELHYSKMIKPADLNREMRDLQKAVTELQLEVSDIQQETVSLQSDIAGEEKGLHDEEVTADHLDLEMLTKHYEVQQNANKPIHIAKEADREGHRFEQILDHLETMNIRWSEGMSNLKGIENKIDAKLLELMNLNKEENKMFSTRRNSLNETESLNTDMEILLRKEQSLLDKCASVTESIQITGRMKKRLMDDVNRINNAATRSHRKFLNLDRLIRTSQDAYSNTRLSYEKLRSALELRRPKEDSNNWDKLTSMFQKEIRNLQKGLADKNVQVAYSKKKVEELQAKLYEMYDQQIESGKELQNLFRATVRMRREREEKSEQCLKLEAQVFRLVTDQKMQHLVLSDCSRVEHDVHKMMDVVRAKYSELKIERSGLQNDLIHSRQKLSEQSEKAKICRNEIESYKNQLAIRTREIQRAHFINLNARLARESIHEEALRSINKYESSKKELDELHLKNKTLRKKITAQENEVVELRQLFEANTHESRKTALSLRERTEELCTFIEGIKAYEMILLHGKAQLTCRELEKNKLEAILDEVRKHMVIVSSNQPDEAKDRLEVETLRNRVYEITEERIDLEAQMHNAKDLSRRRDIHHDLIAKRETENLLDARLTKLEDSLASRTCLHLERDLLLKQVDECTDDAIVKANHLKRQYAKEVKRLVGIRKALYRSSSRIDGMVCETAFARAKADQTEMRYKILKRKILAAEIRFKNGLSPTEEMEAEYKKILWRNKMLWRSKNRPEEFIRKVKTLTGSQIVAERLRPKPKNMMDKWASIEPVVNRVPVICKSRPYRVPKKRPLTSNKTRLLRGKTGLPLCNRVIF